MNDTFAVIGVDIGGTKIAVGLFKLDGEMILQKKQHLEGRSGDEVAQVVIDLANDLIEEATERSFQVQAVGACVPGIYHPKNKTVWAPNIPGWDQYPLHERLTNGLTDNSIPILIESDRSCYILGETWKGNAQGCTDAIFIAVGTGIGAGILSNGNIIAGKSGIAGAIGWSALEQPYKDKYKACGNFEYYASGAGIARSAVEELGKDPDSNSMLVHLAADEISAYQVFEAYDKQDIIAVRVLDKAIGYWGMVVANLISIFNPEKIIFGGGVFGPAANLLDRITLEARKWAQPISMEEVTVEVSSLQGEAGLIGAGYLALKSINIVNHDE
ncbi:MAG: ROK family protein [Bacteroidota bacterium]